MADSIFKVTLNRDNTVSVELGEYEKLLLLSELKKAYKVQAQMSKWLDNNNVPAEQREQYLPIFQNLLHSISFIWDLLKRSGVPDKDIRETIEIPF